MVASAGQGRAGRGRAGRGGAWQGSAGQGNAGQGYTEVVWQNSNLPHYTNHYTDPRLTIVIY